MFNRPQIDRTYGHIQTETGDEAPHVIRKYVLFTNAFGIKNQEWPFAVRLPRYIADVLQPNDWETVARMLDCPAPGQDFSVVEKAITTASICGVSSQDMHAEVATLFAENLYRVFCEKQIQLGNKAWLVPSSMQKVGDPHGSN